MDYQQEYERGLQKCKEEPRSCVHVLSMSSVAVLDLGNSFLDSSCCATETLCLTSSLFTCRLCAALTVAEACGLACCPETWLPPVWPRATRSRCEQRWTQSRP